MPPYKDIKKRKAYAKAWAAANREKCRESSRRWNKANPEKRLTRCRAYQDANPDKMKVYSRRYQQKVKANLMKIYGNSRCVCCGEKELAFLTIEHIGGGGGKEIKKIGAGALYRWLNKQPVNHERYTVLCMNCNMATKHGRTCPHKQTINSIKI